MFYTCTHIVLILGEFALVYSLNLHSVFRPTLRTLIGVLISTGGGSNSLEWFGILSEFSVNWDSGTNQSQS